jgi:hypothetical protein
MKQRKLEWDSDLDINSLGPLCDPNHPTRRNRPHRSILDLLLEGGDLVNARKILAAYPYAQNEYESRMAQSVREEVDARVNWNKLQCLCAYSR